MKILVIIIGLLCMLCIINIIIDSNRFIVKKYTLYSEKIKQPVTFVFVSDLHGKCYGKKNEKLLQAIDDCQPDFVLCGGDIPTAHPGANMDTAISFIKSLCAKYRVYYASGNHEYRLRIYPEKYQGMHERYEKETADANNIRLINESAFARDDIAVHGLELERQYYKRFHKETPTASHIKALFADGIAGEDAYHILLAHNPDHFEAYAECKPDLVLSGHLHGGVGRLPVLGGVISPAFQLFPKYDGGYFRSGDVEMVVSRGLGMHTIPLRFLNPAELVYITISPETTEETSAKLRDIAQK